MAKGGLSYFTKRSGDVHKISHDVLHNQYVLYFIFFVAIGNLFLFVSSDDLMSAGVLFTAGLLTSFFSKNMIVILVTAMVVSNIIRLGFTNRREGFKEDDDDDDDGFKGDDDSDDGFKTGGGDDDSDDGFKGDDDSDEEGFGNGEKEGFKGGFKKKKKKAMKMLEPGSTVDDEGTKMTCSEFESQATSSSSAE